MLIASFAYKLTILLDEKNKEKKNARKGKHKQADQF